MFLLINNLTGFSFCEMVGVFQFAHLNSFRRAIKNQQIYFDKNTQYPYFLITEQGDERKSNSIAILRAKKL